MSVSAELVTVATKASVSFWATSSKPLILLIDTCGASGKTGSSEHENIPNAIPAIASNFKFFIFVIYNLFDRLFFRINHVTQQVKIFSTRNFS